MISLYPHNKQANGPARAPAPRLALEFCSTVDFFPAWGAAQAPVYSAPRLPVPTQILPSPPARALPKKMQNSSVFPAYSAHDLHAAVPKRFSCRAYSPVRDVEAEKLAQLEGFVQNLNKVSADVQLMLVDLRDHPKAFSSMVFIKFVKDVRRALLIRCKSKAARPAMDVLVGYLGELFALYATSLGLNTLWVGGLGFMCKTSVLDDAAGVSEPGKKGDEREAYTAIAIPFGYAKDPSFVLHKKKELPKLYDGPLPRDAELLQLAENIRSSPTAMNKSPFFFRFTYSGRAVEDQATASGASLADLTGLTIRPTAQVALKDTASSMVHVNAWLDCGIVMANAEVSLRSMCKKEVRLTIPNSPESTEIVLTLV